jgi:hypothetical protein
MTTFVKQITSCLLYPAGSIDEVYNLGYATYIRVFIKEEYCIDMTMPLTERRQIENEMIFRRVNEEIGAGLDKLDAMHISDGNPQFVSDDDIILQFRCECSDEDCEARIPIKLSVYKKIHENRDSFVIKLKHQVSAIEKVIATESDYSVVEKNNSTAEPGNDLNKTTIDNSKS